MYTDKPEILFESRTGKIPLKRFVMWFLCNTVIWFVGILWLLQGNEQAGNLCAFFVVVQFALSLFTFSKDVVKQLQEKGPSVNIYFNLFIDFAWAGFLAWFGHFWLAGMYLIGGKFMFDAYRQDI
jgi:hypothetical protein